MGNLFHSVRAWWGEAIEHAFGDPRQEKLHQPQHLAEALLFRSLERSVARDGGLDPGLAGRPGVAAD